MDTFQQIATFIQVALKGNLSRVARDEGVTSAVIGRRMDALESRLGVKLLVRTTRTMALTTEGTAFLEDCQRIVHDLESAEAAVSAGSFAVKGHIRLTAPAGFGRKHVVPVATQFQTLNPEVSITFDLSDRVVDIVNEHFDLAIRIGELPDSNLVSVRLAENRRLVVASPDYLAKSPPIQHPEDLAQHACLTLGQSASQARGWQFLVGKDIVAQKVSGPLECNDGQVLHEWALAGRGLAWRSLWEVSGDLLEGRLISVLDDYATPSNGVYAIYPQRRHLPMRVKRLIEALRESFEAQALHDWTPPS